MLRLERWPLCYPLLQIRARLLKVWWRPQEICVQKEGPRGPSSTGERDPYGTETPDIGEFQGQQEQMCLVFKCCWARLAAVTDLCFNHVECVRVYDYCLE